jgi:crotonobetainyl-CoA:carnitine CoA-transferase CaiB-like acyl-CoA transferase
VNTPLRFSTDCFEPFRAPSMGEHSHAVARELCGLAEDTIERLQGLGVFQ